MSIWKQSSARILSRRVQQATAPSARQLLCCCLAACCIWTGCSAAEDDRTKSVRPNIVLIIVDTLRRDRVGAYGHARATTPHLDTFFEQGSIFANATSPSPCTVPAVQQILTGVQDYDDRDLRLAERLSDQGYETAAVVSQQHFRGADGPHARYLRGFDHFDIQAADELDHHGMTSRSAEEVSTAALAWLDARSDDRPFLLWLHYYDPHDPYEAPEEHRIFPRPDRKIDGDRRKHLKRAMHEALRQADEPMRRAILAKPNPYAHFGAIYSQAQIASLRSLYDAEIRYTDAQIQRVLNALSQSGELGQSLVILTSDHGERLGEENRWAHCQSVHALEINVPLLMRAPGQSTGRRVPRAATTLDIVPTVLEVAGLEYDASQLDGLNLNKLPESRAVYSVWRREHAIQDRAWKLRVGLEENAGRVELYDLIADRGESKDVSAAHGERTATMAASLQRAAAKNSTILPKIEDTLDRLRAIGYVE